MHNLPPILPEIARRLDLIGQRALSTRPTLDASYRLSLDALCREVRGDLVECGVFAGVQSAAMALAVAQSGLRDRRVHLFDSFEGIPESGPRDDATITDLVGVGRSRNKTTGVSACPLDAVKGHMAEWEIDPSLLVYHPGWFSETLPAAVRSNAFPDGIAVLRLDGDLYESTRVCLRALVPLVSPGGVVIIDDYALTGCRRACHEYWRTHPMVGNAPVVLMPVTGGLGPVYYRVGEMPPRRFTP